MSETTRLIWLIALGIGLLGGIPYTIWMGFTIVKKQWRRLLVQITTPMVLLGALLIVTIFVEKAAHKEYLRGIYDAEVELADPLFEYHSPRSIHGDGYSIGVYELPDAIRERFESVDTELLQEYPRHSGSRGSWDIEPWREAPFDPKFEAYLDFALSPYDRDEAPELAKYFTAIRSALASGKTYYAFLKYDHGSDLPGNIDMYIIDLESGRLYEINHNT